MRFLRKFFRRRNEIAHPTLDEVKRMGYASLDDYYHDLYDGEGEKVKF